MGNPLLSAGLYLSLALFFECLRGEIKEEKAHKHIFWGELVLLFLSFVSILLYVIQTYI